MKIYLAMNALLVGAYFLFRILRFSGKLSGLRVGHRHWIWIGQLLLIAAVVAPLGLRSVPEEKLPELSLRVFAPEGGGGSVRGRARELKRAAPLRALEIRERGELSPTWIQRWQRFRMTSEAGLARNLAIVFVLFGMAVSLGRLGSGWLKLRAILLRASPVRRLGSVTIAVSDAISVPFSVRRGWGARAKWIALPPRMLENGDDFRLAVRHELQHHRQGDTLWALAVEGLLCFFFANPFVYLWKRDITEFQEFSCDEALIGRRGVSSREYGSCLVRVAEAALGARRMQVGTTCMAAVSRNPGYFKSFLRRRIEMFASHEKPRAQIWAGALLGTLAVIGVAALSVGMEKTLRAGEAVAVNPGSAAVDPDIQAIAENALSSALDREKAKAGFAIVAEPGTGRILAVANLDRTRERSGHWALGEQMEPASFIKAIVAAEAIETGVTTPQENHHCENGTYKFGSRIYHDWRKQGWDHMTTEDTVAISGDICAIKIGEEIGAEGLRKMLVSFGFGPDGTARSFPEARSGVLPAPDRTHEQDLIAAVPTGFGFRITPVEMLQAFGAIANGGNLLEPRQASDDPGTTRVIRRVLSPQSAEQTKAMLRQVVLRGTGRDHAGSKLYSTAGKTATSYAPDLTKWDLVDGEQKGNFAGFIGFAPLKNPRVEVYVGIRDPGDPSGAHGSAHAAPVFKQITEEVLTQMKVAPDLPQS